MHHAVIQTKQGQHCGAVDVIEERGGSASGKAGMQVCFSTACLSYPAPVECSMCVGYHCCFETPAAHGVRWGAASSERKSEGTFLGEKERDRAGVTRTSESAGSSGPGNAARIPARTRHVGLFIAVGARRAYEADDALGACVVLTRSFAGSPEEISIKDAK